MDWGRSFHPGSLKLCLNFSGLGSLQDGSKPRGAPSQSTCHLHHPRQGPACCASRRLDAPFSDAGTLETVSPHPFFGDDPVAETLGGKLHDGGFLPVLAGNIPPSCFSSLSSRTVPAPPVPKPAREMWYFGRVLESPCPSPSSVKTIRRNFFAVNITEPIVRESSVSATCSNAILKTHLPFRCSRTR